MGKGPDFICLGVGKGGTSWLIRMLKQHPEITSPQKEIHFFNEQTPFHTNNQTNYWRGIEWYENHFPDKGFTGEIATRYLYGSEVAERIYKHYPDVTLFAMLRDPIERAYSHYKHLSRVFYLADDFEQAVEKYPEILNNGLYFKMLERYLAFFDKKQLKVFLFDDLTEDPAGLLTELEEFLGISAFVPQEAHSRVNAAKVPKRMYINHFVTLLKKMKESSCGQLVWRNSAKMRTFGHKAVAKIKQYNLVPAPQQKLSRTTRERLLPYVREDIEQLENLIGRDLSSWKTP